MSDFKKGESKQIALGLVTPTTVVQSTQEKAGFIRLTIKESDGGMKVTASPLVEVVIHKRTIDSLGRAGQLIISGKPGDVTRDVVGPEKEMKQLDNKIRDMKLDRPETKPQEGTFTLVVQPYGVVENLLQQDSGAANTEGLGQGTSANTGGSDPAVNLTPELAAIIQQIGDNIARGGDP